MKSRNNKKVLDVSRPKKRVAAMDVPSAPKLNITKRSILVSEEDPPEESAQPEAATTKRVAKNVAPAAPAVAAPAPTPAEAPKADPPPAPPKPEPAAKPKAPADDSPPDAPPEADASAEPEADAKAAQAKSPAHEQAPEDIKRQQQIEGYIEKREFFVPINAVARKRSVKVSIALTFLELLLGVLLINLMLDAGIIQLLEKIPHTNFFNLQ